MCGIFGAVQVGDKPLTISTIKALAVEAEKRGKHAWGIAWIDADGRTHHYKAPGKVSARLDIFERLLGAKAIIGHTRHATHGEPGDNINNHPHICDGGFLVHNGQIPNHEELVDKHGLLPVTDCDSEVLALLIASPVRSTLLRRVSTSINQCERTYPLAIAGLWGRPGRVVVARRGNPMTVAEGSSGNWYFGSLEPRTWRNAKGVSKKAKKMRAAVARLRFKTMKQDTAVMIDLASGEMTYKALMAFKETGLKVAGSGSGTTAGQNSRERWYNRSSVPQSQRQSHGHFEPRDKTNWRWDGHNWVWAGKGAPGKDAIAEYDKMQQRLFPQAECVSCEPDGCDIDPADAPFDIAMTEEEYEAEIARMIAEEEHLVEMQADQDARDAAYAEAFPDEPMETTEAEIEATMLELGSQWKTDDANLRGGL